MNIQKTEHPSWLSNAYLVWEGPGGHGVLIDGNGVVEPLLERVEHDRITITHVLLTHHHADHVVDAADFRGRFGVPVLGHEATARELGGDVDETVAGGDVIQSGGLQIRAIDTPGHCAGHLAFLVDDADCFTADLIFNGTVGGTASPGGSYEELKRSIMERVLTLPPETNIHPGHREPTTVGAEWDSNPFVRIWRGLDPEQSDRCRVGGRDATLVLWADDYDGGYKAWVRYPSGEDAIVGGSRVERL
jgi:glyoxylase-like metal-dependent hydrolase (beta-lactamase superfamily II)